MQNNCNIYKMKKFLFLMSVLLSGAVLAQRSDDAIAIHGKAGIMKGEGQMINTASTVNLGLQWFTGQKGFFLEGGFLLQDFLIEYEPIQKKLPYTMYGINAMGGWSYENLNPVFFNVKAGGFLGYYTYNKGDNKEEVYNSTLENDVKGLTYGATIEGEVEFVIWRKLTGIASFSQYFYPNDKWIRWNYALAIGAKWYL